MPAAIESPRAATKATPPSAQALQVREERLPDFPQAPPEMAPFVLAAAARRAGLRLRPAEAADLAFLGALFFDLRQSELTAAGWPEALQQSFCNSQFALQHRSFVGNFPGAEFGVVERGEKPIGRLYLDRTRPAFHLIEIGLLSSVRGQGLGSLLLDSIKRGVRRSRAEALTLQVAQQNLAGRRFYARAGFRQTHQDGAHLALRWDRDA